VTSDLARRRYVLRAALALRGNTRESGVLSAALLALVTFLLGCAAVVQIINPGEPACRTNLEHTLGTILVEQGES